MRKVSILKRGSWVAIFAPSGKVIKEDLLKGLCCLEAWGLRCAVKDSIFKSYRYFAGDDATRAKLLVELVSSNKYQAIWAARGGYGALRLLPFLERKLTAIKRPFWLIGFSDVSILLDYFFERFGLVTLHAPNVSSLLEIGLLPLEALYQTLFSKKDILLIGDTWRKGKIQARLVGGNLASLVSLLATPWFPDLSGKILFLEEVNEPPYRIDRMFTQLALSGALKGVVGLALGSFHTIETEILRELVEEIFPNGPIIASLPCGHTKQNFPLFIGANTQIVAKHKKGFLLQKHPTSEM